MITVTLSTDGAAVTIQQQDDDLRALRAVLERLEATLAKRDGLDHTKDHGFDVNAGRDRMIHLRAIEQTAGPIRWRIAELEQEIARLRGELDFTREHGAKLMSELEETELEYGEWKREVFALGEALGLGSKWTTEDALAAIEAPKSIIAAVQACPQAQRQPLRPQRAAIIARLRRALGDET